MLHAGTPLPSSPKQSSVLVVRPSAALECDDCVRELPAKDGGPPTLLVPPGLRDTALLPLLEPYKRYRVWKLVFDDVGSTAMAYGGPACKGE